MAFMVLGKLFQSHGYIFLCSSFRIIGCLSLMVMYADTTLYQRNTGEAFPLTEDARMFHFLASIDIGSFIYGENEVK